MGSPCTAAKGPAWVAHEALPGGQAPKPEESTLANVTQLWGARVPGECSPRHPCLPGFAQATGLDGRLGTTAQRPVQHSLHLPGGPKPPTGQTGACIPAPGPAQLLPRLLPTQPCTGLLEVAPERMREEMLQAGPLSLRWKPALIGGGAISCSPSLAQAVKHSFSLIGLCAEAAADQLTQDHRGNGSSTASNLRPGRRLRQVCVPREPHPQSPGCCPGPPVQWICGGQNWNTSRDPVVQPGPRGQHVGRGCVGLGHRMSLGRLGGKGWKRSEPSPEVVETVASKETAGLCGAPAQTPWGQPFVSKKFPIYSET